MSQSWSSLKKKFETEYLCEKLRGRIRYDFTLYRKSHDGAGLFSVFIDGQLIFQATSFAESYHDEIADGIKRENDIPMRDWNGKEFLFDDENFAAENKAEKIAHEEGIYTTYEIIPCMKAYQNLSVSDALCSENYLFQMFAILDRRTGKRSLLKKLEVYEDLPEWLQKFYKLRFGIEGIV